jgi:prolyl-tRNA synthetase
VPVRIELGPRDLENGTLVFARRDLSTKRTVKRADLIEEAAKEISDVGTELLSRAKAILDVGIKSASTYEGAKGLLSNGWDGIIRTNWCADMDCASEIEKALDKAFLGYPLKDVTSGKVIEDNGQCMACGKPCNTVVYLGRSY